MVKTDEYGYCIPRFERTDFYNDGEWWCHVSFFDLDVLDHVECETDDSSDDFDAVELAKELTGWSCQYSGPGRQFLDFPYAHVQCNRNRVVVKQYGGYDI